MAMLIASLIVGLLGAWYLGVRGGIYAAAATAALLLLAMIAPPLRLYCYGALIIGVVAMGMLAKTKAMSGRTTPRNATTWVKQQAWRYLRRR